jgi:crotonobetainyl-CoA:carnitine CoA-transferase CaiB-like acyl-CoA transferase
MTNALPLAGLRVLDLSRVLAGPVCCQLLGDLGADVVKVERPGAGDDTRGWGPPFVGDGGPSAYYLSCNRNKRSLALDLERPEALGVLDELIRRADVLVENFLPKDAAKFGLTPARLEELNPRLVSCSISGYGRTGPLADVPGYDLIIQATSGLMSITGEPDGAPMKVGVAITDVITGLYAAASVLAGLYGRGKLGRGTNFDLALCDCTLASLVNVAQAALVTRQRPRRYGNAHPHIVPYEAFATADGYLVLGVGNDRQWRRFCETVNRPDWAADARFATNRLRVVNREQLIPKLQALFKTESTAQWERQLALSGVPHAGVRTLDEVLASPQVLARRMLTDVEDAAGYKYPILTTPVHWPGRRVEQTSAPPTLGQHTAEVLRQWLGKSDVEIEELRQSGAIQCGAP